MKKLAWLALLSASLPVVHGCAAVAVGGAATAAVVADDRRMASVVILDQEIELHAYDRLNKAFGDKPVSVSTVSFNRKVLVVGQVPDETSRKKVEEIVKSIPEVREVHNETVISGVSSLTSDANDTAITTKVKARLLDSDKVSANHVKVVTETATVYLMGLVTRDEGEAAARIAASTSGVKSVVKLFEYID
ncbi:MAG: BON domain-containing protein [Pseudomonadota bacterium]